jgi:hypothetical protein
MMNRVIVEKKNPEFNTICESYQIYPYMANANDYVCVDVDSETLCVFTLKYVVWLHTDGYGKPYYPDKPTYVLTLNGPE